MLNKKGKNMEIIYIKPKDLIKSKDFLNNIFDILVECDTEFVPILSSRTTTKQTNFNSIEIYDTNTKPTEYFINITKQHNILAIQNDKVIAFMSFIYNYDKNEFFNKKNINDINNYITSICVKKDFRHQGIAGKLYDYIENSLPNDISSQYISTRTWSTNIANLNILKKRNFVNT